VSRLVQTSEAASLGLHAAVMLADRPDERHTVPELADGLGASEAHLSKVMQTLARAGLVTSTRGPKGGFQLARPASDVSLLDVYEAIEGPVEDAACPFGRPICGRHACIFGGFLSEFDARFRDYMATTTLDQLVESQEERHACHAADHQD
jgi:Rrf2 family protein